MKTDFIEQFLDTFILRKADEASEKGDRKQTACWLLAFVALVVLAVVLLWLKDIS